MNEAEFLDWLEQNFNQTRMELKLVNDDWEATVPVDFNQTRMELKLAKVSVVRP